MRLSEVERQAIIAAATANFGPEVQVWLFGSRVDNTRRGGDIDLYLETTQNDDLPQHKALFLLQIWRSIGARRIDLLVRHPEAPLRAIHRDALETGIKL